MPKYISVGNSAVAFEDLKLLSGKDKIRIMIAMFKGEGLETVGGQIIQYTDLMWDPEKSDGSVVDFAINLNSSDLEDDSNYPDPIEQEEEAISSDYDTLPPTLRPSEIPAS